MVASLWFLWQAYIPCSTYSNMLSFRKGDYLYFSLLKKIRLDISCESSALQRIHMKYCIIFLMC